MSKTALLDAVKTFDLDTVRHILAAKPALAQLETERGLNLLQYCCSRPTAGDRRAADRQLRVAQWLVEQGFDPQVLHTTQPGEDGEEMPARLSLVFFAVARAQNNRLARYFLSLGVEPSAVFAAVWWANAEILKDLVAHGADLNELVGATPLHMAVSLLDRGVTGTPQLARKRRQTLEQLLRLGADPKIPASDGSTPLHLALDKAYDVSIFKLLLARGADPDARGKDGRTVREIAERKRDKRYSHALRQIRDERER
jgi:hypothetical protein